jgi:murein L,D-transpeptidase YafK
MSFFLRRFSGLLVCLIAALALVACSQLLPRDSKLRGSQSIKSSTVNALNAMGSSPGAPMLIRIFKQSSELEVWKANKAGTFKLFKTYNICEWSGTLGPKIKEGDRQAPEGFYTITPWLMNPDSIAYLSFNTGYPNKFDKVMGRTGADLMVHGDCSSRGCYALTNDDIAEVYALARETLNAGNPSFQLQIYPFRMTPQNLAKESQNPNMSFWQTLKEGYDRFEIAKTPPRWDVCDKHYVFDLAAADGAALDAAAACPARGNDPLLAALTAKQATDNQAYTIEVAALTAKQEAAALAAQKAADEAAAVKARGNAVGGFFGGLFGGSAAAAGILDPNKIAPHPAPRPAWL